MDNANDDFFEDLLHPSLAFDHPLDVVNDQDLTISEKRAILASWASDASAPPDAPTTSRALRDRKPVPIDDVLDALRHLDKLARRIAAAGSAHERLSTRHLHRPRQSGLSR